MQDERTSGNEFDFIAWVKARLRDQPASVIAGPGDDCAVLARPASNTLLKVDSVLEGVHFQRTNPEAIGYLPPQAIGYKVMARTISDIAAMGGIPRHAVVMTALPSGSTAELREGLLAGLLKAAKPFDVALVGGDTKSWGEGSDKGGSLCLAVSLTGEMDGLEPMLRSGAKPGDRVFVTGSLGGSILGHHASFIPRVPEGRWLAGFMHEGERAVTSAIDLSDGLSGDLWQICQASGVGCRLDASRIPVAADAQKLAQQEMRAAQGKAHELGDGWSGTPQTALDHALHDGEDFELLFTVRAECAQVLAKAWPFETRLTCIGEVTSWQPQMPAVTTEPSRRVGDGLFICLGDVSQRLPIKGYEHRL